MKTSLSIQNYGPGSERVLIFFHGFMGRGDDFLPVIDLLKGRYRCVTVDLPGHGSSRYRDRPWLDSVTGFPSLARMIIGDADALGIGRFSLYGYSMGGRVAQAVALSAPGRTEHLILESSSFGIADEGERRRRHRDDAAMMKGIQGGDDFRAFLERWYSMPLFRTLKGEAKRRMIDGRMKNDPGELSRSLALLSTGNHPSFLEGLGGAMVPVTYLCGTEDDKYMAEAERGKRALPLLEVILFPGASHNIHVCFPDAVAGTVMHSLEVRRPGGGPGEM